ncbi:MAG: hydroxymethylglutaryl-CoA lyase [Trueperaceae bacterium]|nr:hydroxymethylglutaryl-CoA lyase [Trueperaceae bacterium]
MNGQATVLGATTTVVRTFPPDRPLPRAVRLVEVGLRDGLQSLPAVLPTEQKLALIDALLAAGVTSLQVASFVNPVRVPQMADADELSKRLAPLLEGRPEVRLSGLALNRRGVERLAAAGLRHVDLSLSASEPHSRRNAGMSVEEAEGHIRAAVGTAIGLGLEVRAGVQCVFGSAPGDEVPLERVLRLSETLIAAGATELALADSAGLADPLRLATVVAAVQERVAPVAITLHLHDTRGLGMANLVTALRLGIASFDTAFGGLGGCPFITGAAGNLGTEDVVFLFDSLGLNTGVDLLGVARATRLAEGWSAASMPSRLYQLVKEGAIEPDEEEQRGTDGR